MVRIRRKFHDPNPSEDPLWQKYRLQTFQSYISAKKPMRRRRSEPPLLLNFDYLEEAQQDQCNGVVHYDPTVPLPAFYDPPEVCFEDFRYRSQPMLFPLVTIQTHSGDFGHQNQPNSIYTVQEAPITKEQKDKQYCDSQAWKIGICIVLIVVASVGAFVAYILYNKYIAMKD